MMMKAGKNGYLALIAYHFDDCSDEAYSSVEESLSLKYGEPEPSSNDLLFDALYFDADDIIKQLSELPPLREGSNACRTIGAIYIFHVIFSEGKDDVHVIIYYDPTIADLVNIEGIQKMPAAVSHPRGRLNKITT